MKEISDIIQAYHKASKEGKKSALATVVKVVGSSYRRPGARMLVTEDGQLTGAISGGCLEGDALRKAISAIMQEENKLVTYDTTDEDDAKFGVQLGCNGIVYILFEPLNKQLVNDPLSLLIALKEKREPAVLITLFSLVGKLQSGTGLLYRPDDLQSGISDDFSTQLQRDMECVYDNKQSAIHTYNHFESRVEALLEYVPPVISLVIAGAGNDAQPLAKIAQLIGWKTTIIDGRPTHVNAARFPGADKLILAKSEDGLPDIMIDEYTAFVLMTHNYNYDKNLLRLLLKSNAVYIGTLGPKKKLLRMLEELDLSTNGNLARVHGPIGLDIGAETAEEIAISIIAEIKTVFSGASAGFLKDKNAPIHAYALKNSE